MAEQQYSRPFPQRLIYGAATLDADYPVRKSYADNDGIRRGRRCPIFVIWNRLARICYSDEYRANHPEGDRRTMTPEWRDSFMKFREWLTAQPGWESGVYVKLRYGQNEYGPTTVYLSPPDRTADAPTDWRSTRLPFPG